MLKTFKNRLSAQNCTLRNSFLSKPIVSQVQKKAFLIDKQSCVLPSKIKQLIVYTKPDIPPRFTLNGETY